LPKGSANGRVARRLAGDEWAAVLTLVRGKKMTNRKIFPTVAPFICGGEREREGLGRPLGLVTDVGVEPDR
jgi:hypothetical protein